MPTPRSSPKTKEQRLITEFRVAWGDIDGRSAPVSQRELGEKLEPPVHLMTVSAWETKEGSGPSAFYWGQLALLAEEKGLQNFCKDFQLARVNKVRTSEQELQLAMDALVELGMALYEKGCTNEQRRKLAQQATEMADALLFEKTQRMSLDRSRTALNKIRDIRNEVMLGRAGTKAKTQVIPFPDPTVALIERTANQIVMGRKES